MQFFSLSSFLDFVPENPKSTMILDRDVQLVVLSQVQVVLQFVLSACKPGTFQGWDHDV